MKVELFFSLINAGLFPLKCSDSKGAMLTWHMSVEALDLLNACNSDRCWPTAEESALQVVRFDSITGDSNARPPRSREGYVPAPTIEWSRGCMPITLGGVIA